MKDHLKIVDEKYNEYMFGSQKNIVDQIGFFNIGYWTDGEGNIESSQIKLIETLISHFPSKNGSVLDVACGKGASTKFLTRYFSPKDVVGINISPKQLVECRKEAPECTFMLMDAADLEYDDASFDNILCIEAAFHFNTRAAFLKEAHRVMKPGGTLAMSDVLFRRDVSLPDIPKENYLPDTEAYKKLLHEIGFKNVTVEDSTALSIKPLLRHLKSLEEKSNSGMDKSQLSTSIAGIKSFYDRCLCCCMVFATAQ